MWQRQVNILGVIFILVTFLTWMTSRFLPFNFLRIFVRTGNLFHEIIETFPLVSGHKTITNDSKTRNKRSTDRER